jgi:hypothetical protein
LFKGVGKTIFTLNSITPNPYVQKVVNALLFYRKPGDHSLSSDQQTSSTIHGSNIRLQSFPRTLFRPCNYVNWLILVVILQVGTCKIICKKTKKYKYHDKTIAYTCTVVG